MPSSHNKFAIRAAKRINPKLEERPLQFFESLLLILAPILIGMLTNCIRRPDPTPEQLRAKLQHEWNRDPRKVREAVAKQALRQARR